MSKSERRMSVRIDEDLARKLDHIVDYEERSITKQIMFLMKSRVRDFEREHGEIDLSLIKGDGQ